jgi:hypothetical protein
MNALVLLLSLALPLQAPAKDIRLFNSGNLKQLKQFTL